MNDQISQPMQHYYQPIQMPDADRWRFDTGSILEQFRHFLLGEIEDPATGKWKKVGEQIMNDTGIKECITYLIPVINPNTLFSYLTKDEIYEMTKMTVLRFNDLFYEKGEEFGIHPYSVPILLNQIGDFIFTTFKRALEAGERKSLTQMFEERVIKTQSDQGKQGFRVPSVFGRNKKEGVVYG